MVLTSKHKEVLAVAVFMGKHPASSRKKLPGCGCKKEVLAHLLFLGCTVVKFCYISTWYIVHEYTAL